MKRTPTGGAESYEDLEGRGLRIRQILDSSDSFNSDTPLKASNRGEGSGDKRGGGAYPSSASQEGNVMVAFTLKEVGQCFLLLRVFAYGRERCDDG